MIAETERIHEHVRIEHIADEPIARLVMEGSERSLNAFDADKVDAMTTGVESLAGRVDCLVVTGEPVFSTGADLTAIDRVPQDERSAKIDSIAAASNRFIRSIRGFPAPVVAAVTGVAAGGGLGFALAADLVAVHEDAVLDTAYARIGLTPDNSTSFFLTRALGPYRARELLFDPEPVSANEAVRLGLANDVYDVPQSAFVDAVTEDTTDYADGPTETHARTKELVDSALENDLDQHLEGERETIARTSETDTFDEGLTAFLDDRDPEWP